MSREPPVKSSSPSTRSRQCQWNGGSPCHKACWIVRGSGKCSHSWPQGPPTWLLQDKFLTLMMSISKNDKQPENDK